MTSQILAAQRELAEARVEFEEMQEAGDLEDQLEAAIRLAKAEEGYAAIRSMKGAAREPEAREGEE